MQLAPNPRESPGEYCLRTAFTKVEQHRADRSTEASARFRRHRTVRHPIDREYAPECEVGSSMSGVDEVSEGLEHAVPVELLPYPGDVCARLGDETLVEQDALEGGGKKVRVVGWYCNTEALGGDQLGKHIALGHNHRQPGPEVIQNASAKRHSRLDM